MPTQTSSPSTPLSATAIHQLQATVDELLPHQQRLSLQTAPGWLQLALLVARAGVHRQWRAADHPGLHLLKAMEDVGGHFAHQTVKDEVGDEAYVAWHSIRPDQHLLRVGFSALNSSLNALGLSPLPANVFPPKLPNPQTHPDAQHYIHSTELALRWLDASAAHTVAHPDAPAWALPPALDAGLQCPESSVRVLLQAGSGGAVAVLRVRAVREPGAHLLLAPMPASLCLLLDASFGQALNTVTQFLRHTLPQAGSPPPGLPGLIDVALAWDLAPPIGEDTPLAAIEGDSAGAAFACAALLALAPYAPPALQASLWAARPLMGEAFMTAAISPQGHLRPVGGLQGKARALQPLSLALTAWAKRRDPGRAAHHPIYLAPGQPGRQQLPGEFKPEEPPTVADLLQRIAQRARPSSPAHEAALALVLEHPNDLAAAASALRAPEHKGTAERLRTAPLSHWSHLAVRDLVRWEHQGGPLQAEFVPLAISGKSGGAWGGGRYTGLVQLLDELDQRLNPAAFALEGPPGAGKTTLLRHHMQWLCHQTLHAQAPDPSATAPARPMVLPMYLSLADWADTEVPAAHRSARARSEWFKQFIQEQVQRQLEEEGWSPALRDSLHETDRPAPWVWRWLIDGLNELPHPANETRAERARAIVAALKAHYGMRLPMLLSVREDHMSSTDWVWVRVEAWSDQDRADYLRKRFAPLDLQQPGSAQTTTEKVQALLQALPDSSRALYTRPMALAMLCDVYLASPEQGLPPHRAALYTAHLWFLLRRELGRTRHTGYTPRNPALFQNSALLSPTDRDWIEAADTWPASPDELPQQGMLLRGLLDQAEHQYWGELDRGEKQDQRCQVAVPLDSVQVLDAQGQPVDPNLRQQWLEAVEVLGLADPADQRKGLFRFSHQSWGEFLASVRLLQRSPEALAAARARGDAAAQARWRRIFEQTRAPEAGRADADGRVPVLGAQAELQAMGQAVADAWGSVPPAVWQRLREEGLTASLDEVILHLSSDKVNPVSETAFWNWASRHNTPLVNNPEQPDPETDLIWPDGLGGLHLHPGRWAPAYGVPGAFGQADWSAHAAGWQVWYRTLWPPFQRAFDRWLRAQPELAVEAGTERVKALLASQGRLGLPPPADTREVLTLALCAQPPTRAAAWLATLIAQGDWRAAVPAALLLRPLLEAPKPGLPVNDGHWFDEPRHRHPVLQHLRRLLLLRVVDAGAAVRQRLRRGGVLAALAQPVARLELEYPALAAHWRSAWAQAFATGPGVDLRERLQAGLWLGELGDNLRYLRWTVSASEPGGSTEDASDGAASRVGICLHPRNWRGPGRPGQGQTFRIGDDQGEWSDAKPEWTVELPAARLAAYPVTVMEYAALTGQTLPLGLQRTPSSLIEPDSNNPLQPLSGISWEESMALTDWYRPVYADLIKRRKLLRWQAAGYALELPTEVQREAWARGPARAGQPQADYTHSASADDPPLPLLFNHHATGWQQPSPVGVFSRGLNPWGLDDLAGNVWNWCSNAFPRDTDYRQAHRSGLLKQLSTPAVRAQSSDKKPLLALRGGSFNDTADDALLAYRYHFRPDYVNGNIGLRWQMSRSIF